ncbi:hypothetical protein V8N76_004526 [Salmonella enterica]
MADVLGIRRPVLTRLRFIEAMLVRHRFVNRRLLTGVFGLQTAMASKDLALYASLNPTVHMNYHTKNWEPEAEFVPLAGLLHMPAADYLVAIGKVFDVEFGMVTLKTEFGVLKTRGGK